MYGKSASFFSRLGFDPSSLSFEKRPPNKPIAVVLNNKNVSHPKRILKPICMSPKRRVKILMPPSLLHPPPVEPIIVSRARLLFWNGIRFSSTIVVCARFRVTKPLSRIMNLLLSTTPVYKSSPLHRREHLTSPAKGGECNFLNDPFPER